MSSSLKLWKKTAASSLILAGLLVGYTAPAQAGFNWTPPANRAVANPHVFAPSAPTNAGPLTPELDAPLSVPVAPVATAPVEAPNMAELPVVEDHSKQAISTNACPMHGTAANCMIPPKEEAPLVLDTTKPEEAPVAPTPVAPAPVTDSNIDVIQGFGSDIPLAIALRDIVPTGYAYAFADKTIAGTKISWQGGKSWEDTLTDALASKGLVFGTAGHVITLSYAATPYTPRTAAPMTPVTEPAPIAEAAPVAEQQPLDLTKEDNVNAEPTPTAQTSPTATKNDGPRTYSAKEMVVDMDSHSKWQARPGSTLHQVIEIWSKQANVDLQWLSPYDYPINNAFVHEGTFNEAIASLLSSYASESPRPRGRLYPNAPDGPSVLMIN